MKNRILFALAVFISLIAQGFWLAPTRFDLLLQHVSALGNIVAGFAFLALAFPLYISASRHTLHRSTAARTVAILLIIQLSVPVGILGMNNFASDSRGAGFLLSSLITLLTAFGIISATRSVDPATAHIEDLAADDTDVLNADALNEQIATLARRLSVEKRRTLQLTYLNELSQQLEAELEPEVSAQLAVNTLERAIECSSVTLFMHEPNNQRYVVLTTVGRHAHTTPPGYQQDSNTGILGRTTRLKKTQVVYDAHVDVDFLRLMDSLTRSMISVPIMQDNQIKGVIEIGSDKPHAFGSIDVIFAENVALELLRAWERVSYHQRLRELIQAGVSLTTVLDPQAAVQEVALLAQKNLQARFVFVTLLDQQGAFSRNASSGTAPRLLASLNESPVNETLIQAALNSVKPFRIRDLRKYANPNKIQLDSPNLRSALAIPIRLHRLSIGAIIAFGKQEGVFFSENDEALADLLSSQAAAAIESSWLLQELQSTLGNISMLHQLSVNVIQAEELSDAAELIGLAGHKVGNASKTGIILFTREGNVEAEVEIDEAGLHSRGEHPHEIISQAMQASHSIIIPDEEGTTLVCYPLLTPRGTYGALWMNIPETRGQNYANMQTLANQAAVALERSLLLEESRRQAKQLEAAYAELEITYDRTLTALMSALDARDRETEGHSIRVSRMACLLGELVGVTGLELKALERGSLLHDIGKIGISDVILHKPGKLTDDEWKIMRVHPDIGARIVERIPFLQDALPVIQYHHERWNGSGYPFGLKGTDIPLQARIFALADVFDALTSKRAYRSKSSAEETVTYLQEQAGVLFDPELVKLFLSLPYQEMIDGGSADV